MCIENNLEEKNVDFNGVGTTDLISVTTELESKDGSSMHRCQLTYSHAKWELPMFLCVRGKTVIFFFILSAFS